MKWPWNYIKEKREEKERIESEISRKVAELTNIIEKQKQKEHDSHIIDSLSTRDYCSPYDYVKLNYMDDGVTEISLIHGYESFIFKLSKNNTYLIGEFLHECNNKS